jgi:hypothetical protein
VPISQVQLSNTFNEFRITFNNAANSINSLENGIGTLSINTLSANTITATSQFTGPATGLTGTASSLSIGGNAATATSATNLAGGAINRVPVQTGAGATSFVVAPNTASTFLGWNGSEFAWSAPSGAGNVVGPESATDNAITRFDATTGKVIQNSSVTIADDGAITAPSVGSIIPFYFNTYASFPSASTYHGAVAHAHDTSRLYYAHGGTWIMLANAATGTNAQLLANDGSSGFSNVTVGNGLSFSAGQLSATGVTSVDFSGGTTGLTVSGSPITTTGTITLAGTLAVANGGTGLSTTTAYGLITAGTTSNGTFQQVSGTGTAGQILTSNGASALPSWQAAPASGISTGKSIAMSMIFGF